MILVTGAAGYLGSHMCAALLEEGIDVLGTDNYSRSRRDVPDRLSLLAGRPVSFVTGDLRNRDFVMDLLGTVRPEAVIHFAGLKSLPESFRIPEEYRENNVTATGYLLEAMERVGADTLVFSSSAVVYSPGALVPLREEAPLEPASPYGQTKLEAETRIRRETEKGWLKAGILRYFNPAGAHVSGLLGENPLNPPENLFPRILQVAAGREPFLTLWGTDLPTPDGTGIRDYVHVQDLIRGHRQTLHYLGGLSPGTVATFNLGRGEGASVLQVLEAFWRATGIRIPVRAFPARPGDLPESRADITRAMEVLGFRPEGSLEDMCRDSWRWIKTEMGI